MKKKKTIRNSNKRRHFGSFNWKLKFKTMAVKKNEIKNYAFSFHFIVSEMRSFAM